MTDTSKYISLQKKRQEEQMLFEKNKKKIQENLNKARATEPTSKEIDNPNKNNQTNDSSDSSSDSSNGTYSSSGDSRIKIEINGKKPTYNRSEKQEDEIITIGNEKENKNKKKKKKKNKKKKNNKKKKLNSQTVDQGNDETEEFIKKRSKKNPTVDTSFLPDKERDLQEKKERLALKKKWNEEQEKIKNEKIEVTYSYWDGTGHRRTMIVKKGTTISSFLHQVRTVFQRELKGAEVEDLMFIKEDLILPINYSFYDLIVTKARGKSGPLFDWGAHEDVRLFADSRKEKKESHAAKVVLRSWYNKNKHDFPACRWEVFDPKVVRDKYTIK
ncbi:xap-5 protein-related [Anaeramoeba flamelloides]|uniref:Xap-5 protein-related n=1 Tax=Anaeramoeba flamelloides TaxID=1746091 RepID=A0ABQ8Y5N4_9EUKA|nr:xap-5 protein-related [Anaeramoeba flamelloides]